MVGQALQIEMISIYIGIFLIYINSFLFEVIFFSSNYRVYIDNAIGWLDTNQFYRLNFSLVFLFFLVIVSHISNNTRV